MASKLSEKKSIIVEIRGKFYVKASKASFQEDHASKAKELIRAKRNNFAMACSTDSASTKLV